MRVHVCSTFQSGSTRRQLCSWLWAKAGPGGLFDGRSPRTGKGRNKSESRMKRMQSSIPSRKMLTTAPPRETGTARPPLNSDVIDSYADLLERLKKLPKPEPGRTRVYRGQTNAYPLLPSGLRTNGVYRKHTWRSYMKTIALGMPGIAEHLLDAPLLSIWIEAIAQHYGTGSRFLDVTRDIDIALWFALHRARGEIVWRSARNKYPLQERIIAFGAIEGTAEVLVADRTCRYAPFEDGVGWLHVLDVPDWDGQSELGHGHLIDLERAPPILHFRASARMNAQCACLVAADSEIGSSFHACPPIAMCWPLKGNERVLRSVEAVFPDLDQDPWYALFLSIPLHIQPGPSQWVQDPRRGEGWIVPVNLRWDRPLPVTLYVNENSENSSKHSSARDNLLVPPSVYATLPPKHAAAIETITNWISGTSGESEEYRLDRATVILLESPLVSTLPPLELCNQALLRADIAKHTESFHARQIPEGPIVMENGRAKVDLTKAQREEYSKLLTTPFSLTNVFLEFSPLEEISWDKIGNLDLRVLRAARLMHDVKRFVIFLYYQSLSSDPQSPGLTEEGPLFYEFNETDRRFELAIADVDGWRWEGISGQHPSDRPFIGILSLLRELSPGPGLELKADPFALEAKKEARWKFATAIRSRSAYLRHAYFLEDGRQILAVEGATTSTSEGWLSNEPFDPNSSPIRQVLKFEADVPWPNVDPEGIRNWINENLNYKV